MRNINTIEYLGIWETLYNQKWVANTNAIGIVAKSGRYGGLMFIKILRLSLQVGFLLSLNYTL